MDPLCCNHLILNTAYRPILKPILKIFSYFCIILWYIDPLLGNDREANNSTTTVTRQRPLNSNRGTVFSVRSALGRYKQGKPRESKLVSRELL
jgi:hypothetical protein